MTATNKLMLLHFLIDLLNPELFPFSVEVIFSRITYNKVLNEILGRRRSILSTAHTKVVVP